MLLGILIPMIILLSSRLRQRPFLHWLALLFVVVGLIAYRWDTNMVGQLVVFNFLPEQSVPLFTSYRPALVEWRVGLGVIAFGLLGFTLGVRYFRIVDHPLTQVALAKRPTTALAHATD